MRTLTAISAVLGLAVSAAGLVPAPAVAGEGEPVVRLDAASLSAPEVAVATDGTTVAAWTGQGDGRSQVRVAVRRPGGGWEQTTLASWATPDRRSHVRGRPQLTRGPGGRVLAVWVSGRLRLVESVWSADVGWSRPVPITSRDSRAIIPELASNPTGQAVLSWHDKARGGELRLRVAVRRQGSWLIRPLGHSHDNGWDRAQAPVGIDAAGNALVAWYEAHSGDATSRGSRLAAGRTTWEEPHAFGWVSEFGAEGVHTSLVVHPDGAALVCDVIYNGPNCHVRVGGQPWVVEDAPFAQRFATSDDELLSYGRFDRNVNSRADDGTWTSSAPFPWDFGPSVVAVDDAGHAAAVSVRTEEVLISVRLSDGAWGPVETIAREGGTTDPFAERAVAAAIAADGTVTVVWRDTTGSPVESLRFSAVPATP